MSIENRKKQLEQLLWEAEDYFTYCQAYEFETLEPYYKRVTRAKLWSPETEEDYERTLEELEAAKANIKQLYEKEMVRIDLWGEQMPQITEYKVNDKNYRDNPDFRPFMMCYQVPEGVEIAGAMLIGGGGGRNNMQEGHYYADYFSKNGYQCFILNYRLAPWSAAESALDIQRAIRVVRSKAEEYGIDPNKICLAGNSASSMNSANVNNYFYGDILPTLVDASYVLDEIDRIDSSVNAQIHTAGVPKELINLNYPPCFLVMGCDDFSFSSFYEGANLLHRHGIPCEVHTFAGVPHAFNMGYDTISEAVYSNIAWWPKLALNWLPHAFAHQPAGALFPKEGIMGRPGIRTKAHAR